MKYLVVLLVLSVLSSCNAGKYYFNKRMNHDEKYIPEEDQSLQENLENVDSTNNELIDLEIQILDNNKIDMNEITEIPNHEEPKVNYEEEVSENVILFNKDSVAKQKPAIKTSKVSHKSENTINPLTFFMTLIAIFVGIMLVYGIVTNIYAILFALPTILIILGVGAVIIAAICGIGLLLIELEILGPTGESLN